MYSKNNKYMQEQKSANRAQRFSLRKLSIGTVSVLLGTLMFFSNGQVSADTTNADTSADTTNVTSTANDTSASAVTLNSASTAASDANNSAAASSAAASAQTATAASASAASQSAAATSTADSSQAASTAPAATTAASSAATDNAASAEGKITDEGKAKGLTDSDVTPEMSDANGASLVLDNSSQIPSGYKADPTEGRYTFGILSLGPINDSGLTSYNQTYGVNYYIRLSTAAKATDGVYDDTVYIQLIDADQDKVIWETSAKPGDAKKSIDALNPTNGNPFQYSYVENTVNGVTTKTISFDASPIDTKNGSMYSTAVYQVGSDSQTSSTAVSFNYPSPSTIETRYIAKDAAGNETILATYDETGRPGSSYTVSGTRDFVGYDLVSVPSETTGTLKAGYKVGDLLVSTPRKYTNSLQMVRTSLITSTDGTSIISIRVAENSASLDDINDPNIWKVVFASEELKPGEWSTTGNNLANYNGSHEKGAFVITHEIAKAAGFTDEQLVGEYVFNWLLLNINPEGQKPADYYYAPQGQVKINYVTSDGTVIQAPVSAYENSGANTSYDVTGSTYQPQTITVNGKTYRYVKSDKSMGTTGTTEVNGYTYNVNPSDATGTIKSTTVNDVYYVYEQVTYHTEAESKDVTRTIEYYDSVTGEAIPADLEKTVTQTVTLNRTKIYDDQNNFIGYGTVSEDGSSYTLDDSWKVADQTWTKQDSADLSDYGYTAPDRASVAAVTVDGDTTNVTEKVYYGHQTVPVTPENPGTPGEPINPKGNVDYPDGVSKDDLTSTVTRTINYVDEDGNAVNGSPDGTSSYVQTAEFTRTAILDKVTGKILGYDTNNDDKVDTESADRAWTPTEKTLEAVKSADPSSVGYDKVDKSTVESLLVTPGQADTTVTVTYSNNQVSGTIKYIDDTTGVELDSDTLPTGKVGSKINYTTENKIKSYEDQGYELVSSDFTDGSQVYEKEGNDFVVHLKHKTQTITPNDPNPVTPGEPINPDDPNSPVYGEETNRKNLVKDASQTIHYVGAGDDTPADNVVTQKDAFTRTVTIDKVTGKVLSYTDWTGEKTFNTVDTPVVEGYHADKKAAGGLTATVDNPDVEETVTYAPNGKLVPVDPNGTPIPGADTPTYPTDPNDPTKVVPNEPIPDVPNWTPVDPSPVTPSNPGEDTPVPYKQVVSGTIKYVDDTTGKTLSSEDLPEGTVGSKINYTTEDKIKSYEDQGYELVSSDFTDGSQVYEKDGNDFVVHLKHKTQTITPNDPTPVTPGQPINPSDPDSPVYPTDTDRGNLVKDASQTIHYVGAGEDTPADNVVTQKDAFTRTVTIDKVTGEVLSYTDWTGEKTFNNVDTPVVDGYHADKKVAGGLTATVDNPDVEETVTYAPNGKLIPVDPNGTPIPGADTPTYPTDPNDPTKVVPNEPIPDVPNWTPVDPSPVTPANPGEDTPVPYTQNQYGLTEKFVDEDGNELSPSVNKGSSYKSGDGFDVTGDAKVINGYVLVKQDNTKGTFGNGDETATFIYKKIGKIIPVDPNGNPIPGADTPIYQNDPDDPTKVVPNEPTPEVPGYTPSTPSVTPEDPTKDTPVPYTQNQYGLTEKFVDEDGNELSPSVNKGSSYKNGDGFDVTGDAKVINGYVLVKQDNTKGTFGNGDETATFIYKKIGKIIPVDPNGNPIPGADTPIYQNDPNDPTKVIPNEPIPEVPSYTPVDPSPITPADPTVDTPVPYTKNETPTTPTTPTTPGEPTTPVTPAEPAQPQTPAAPAGQGQATPTSAKTEAAKQATLPQTGNDKNEATAAMGLGFAGVASMLALFGTRKKRRED
ncbi:mucin-binding protein [Limosilactobacillus mucosae]|uniref:mucin-binding protein n=2 Tax=Limosilactobacillus mucosae TaxID=97478 RepID=UPI00233F3C68|nr:MucBP domain-containing protein [Limosilactobacillus mucosae]MDC2843045.1 MucBP domain-containing protein [Limosilactobacillus mucosae]